MNQTKPIRVNSIDILRALTMVLMIFVNDLWSLKGIPDWLEHTQAAEDGMGLADTVFPAFLFITGMSIPLAINFRRSKGDSNGKICWHIILRSVALLTMGLWLVNGEYLNETATGMRRILWNSICCTCFILIWNTWPASINRLLLNIIKVVSWITLLSLAWICRGGGLPGHPGHFATHWWGILGLIGWAYLVSALVFALSSARFIPVFMAWLFFLFLCIATHAGWLADIPMASKILSPFAGGAMPALVTGGVLSSMIFLHFREKNQQNKMMSLLFLLALLLLILGFYTRTFWGISKIRATPAWVLICSAITILMFQLVYTIADIFQKPRFLSFIKPAGTNTLLCYLMPYYAYALVLTGLFLPGFLLTGLVGLIKSLIFSLLMVALTGFLGKKGVRLKL